MTPASRTNPFEGTPYQAARRLMSRTMTEIYEVDSKGGRCLAKILRPEFLALPQVVDRLRLEADILSAVEDPHVVRLLDYRTTPAGRPFIVLERLVGHTLRLQLVRRRAPHPLDAAPRARTSFRGTSAT